MSLAISITLGDTPKEFSLEANLTTSVNPYFLFTCSKERPVDPASRLVIPFRSNLDTFFSVITSPPYVFVINRTARALSLIE